MAPSTRHVARRSSGQAWHARRVRAVQVVRPTGPEDMEIRDVPEPVPGPDDVLVDVHTVGVAFPDLLLSRGLYQIRPELPFTPGLDFAGTVRSVPDGSEFAPGQPVAGVARYGTAAEVVANPVGATFPLPEGISFEAGAAIGLNYLTAHFALLERGDLQAGETVLVHGGAGGVGTAALQVARGYGARPIAVVSSLERAEFAREAGAGEAVLVDGFRSAVEVITGGRGVDVVVDPVGGEVFTDSLRLLVPFGRLLVVGFAAGQQIPQVRVNRLLLNNIDVRGVSWGGFAMTRPGYLRGQWDQLTPLMTSGVIDPPIGATYDLDGFAEAVRSLQERRTLGKAVVRVR